jgi:hypothetical protein
MSPHWAFLINLLATWYLVGLIWMVQVVHYRLFDRVGDDGFARYELDHANLITPIVGPPMVVELATAALLVVSAPAAMPTWARVAGLATVLLIWASTAVIQVPCHSRLAAGFNLEDYQLLVSSNWIRTVLWTARGLLMAYFAARLLSHPAALP